MMFTGVMEQHREQLPALKQGLHVSMLKYNSSQSNLPSLEEGEVMQALSPHCWL